MASQDATSRSLALAQKLSQVDVAGSKLVAGWLEDDNLLIAFAARKVLHPEYGIRRRTITWHVRPIKAAFFATELVDGIMERANFRNRDDAICLAQRLLDHGIIFKIGGHRNKFSDDRRRIYQCRITMHRDDAGHCRVVTDAGKEITSWDVVQDHCSVAIKQIEIQIPMDMIDLQSYEFWTHSVYVRGVERGFRYGYRAITHPLYCTGKDAQGELDYSEVTKDMDTESLTDSASNGSDGIGSDVLLSRKTTSSGISTDEINSLQQEAAVVGSVVVRKVFSSIARPMIVELRVPLENADLDDDDHHIVLPPGVLVKEGDNLMQDLGVEIMFQCFNHVWQHSALIKSKYKQPPFSLSYEVFPTSATQGFMEAVTGLESLKEYNWQAWREKYGDDPERVDAMVRSTVGSYIGAYVCG